MERSFHTYGCPLDNVTEFNYLGRVVTAGDENWPEVTVKLQKARKSWGRMLRIFIREGADPKVSGLFFKAVVQAVLLLGEEMWVLTPRMERSLSRFHHRFARRLTGRHSSSQGVGVGTILRWRWKWRKRASSRSGPTSRGGRIQSRSILQCDQFWTSVNVLLGFQGHRCNHGGVSRKDWTWRGRMRDHSRGQKESRRKERRR